MKGDWFKAFQKNHNLEFTDEDYKEWSSMVDTALPIYQKYLSKGSSILECCCGLGCTAIPLSHYYKVTAFDIDERILDYTLKNAMKYSKNIRVVKADFRKIVEVFGPDSFKACNSGGVLEHYTIDEIHGLVDKQLIIAPLVFISVPLGDGIKTENEYGIIRYNYTEKQWLDEILKDYTLVYNTTFQSHPKIAKRGKKELMMIVKR